MSKVCDQCGKLHDGELFELGYLRPDAVVAMDPEDRAARVRESNDLCAIGEDRYFVRATLPLSIPEIGDDYRIGVWVELPQASYERVRELWTDEDQASEPPFAAILANEVRHHPGSQGQGVTLHLTGPKTRPSVFVVDESHPLAVEQRAGITLHRATEYTYGAV
jgi:hypothetical protein